MILQRQPALGYTGYVVAGFVRNRKTNCGWFRQKPDAGKKTFRCTRPVSDATSYSCNMSPQVTHLRRSTMQTHRLSKTTLAIIIVAVGWMSLWSQTSGAPTGSIPQNTERLEVLSSLLPSGVQQIVVVDSQNRSMAIYHIDPALGKLVLRSVRNLTWDLSMEQFNGQAPLPSDLRQARP